MDTLISDSIVKKVGSLDIDRGRTRDGSLKVYQFDCLDDCCGVSCDVYEKCHADKKGICAVQKQYISALLDILYRNFCEQLTEPLLFKVGMHLIPMYKMLCKMKIAEMGVESMVGSDLNGKPYIHPIYKEIRETIKAINGAWTLLNLDEYFESPDDGKLKIIKSKQAAAALTVAV